MSRHPAAASVLKGYLLAGVGVLILSPDSLLLRLIDLDVVTISWWRGAGTALVGYIWLRLLERGQLWAFIKTCPRALWLVVLLQPVGTTSFVVAIELTSVANVVVIVAALPLITAIFAWIGLREKLLPETWAAILIASIGVTLVYISGISTGGGLGLLAVTVSISSHALTVTLFRKYRDRSMVPIFVLAGLFQIIVLYPFSTFGGVLDTQTWVYIAAMVLIVNIIPFILLSKAPRYITAAETSLMLLIETILAPLWVWLVFLEVPSLQTVLGGIIIVFAVILNCAVTIWRQRQLSRQSLEVAPEL